MIDSLLAGDFQAFGSALKHILLPAFTLGFVHLGVVARQVRAAMLEELQQDYIRTAKANGLSRFKVVFTEALPNAMIPSITVLGLATTQAAWLYFFADLAPPATIVAFSLLWSVGFIAPSIGTGLACLPRVLRDLRDQPYG
ncbi:MAG: ABC transporter permease, partial [Actinomycetia bacterium]|nr:ABC transporter permease [Actinomycetes bacterium]